MSDKLINPFSYTSASALQLTIELIRAGKITYASDAANSIIEIRKILEEEKNKITSRSDKE
ncbi:MAG: hypothetical protein PIK35_12430 [Enterobacter roggenkampii]